MIIFSKHFLSFQYVSYRAQIGNQSAIQMSWDSSANFKISVSARFEEIGSMLFPLGQEKNVWKQLKFTHEKSIF